MGGTAPDIDESVLRRRMNFLERAASSSLGRDPHLHHTSSGSGSGSGAITARNHPRGSSSSSPLGAEEEYNDDEDSDESASSKSKANPSDQSSSSFHGHNPEDAGQPAWYQFDWVVTIALISPVGQIVTGGDHVKNLFLTMLLVYYLHQLIEVPWRLYINSLPRRSIISQDEDLPSVKSAKASLRWNNSLFLLASLISPWAGASLLLTVAPYITGTSPSPSYFSTTLFILATSIRPWKHLASRMSAHTADLHTAVHYPLPNSVSTEKQLLEGKIDELSARLDKFEKLMNRLRHRVGDSIDELYDVVEGLEKGLGSSENVVGRLEGRVRGVEDDMARRSSAVESLWEYGRHTQHFLDATIPKPILSFLMRFLPSGSTGGLLPPSSSQQSPLSPTAAGKRRVRIHSSNGAIGSGAVASLETIPEEDTNVSTPAHSPPVGRRVKPTIYIRSQPPSRPLGRKVVDLVLFPWGLAWKLVWRS